MQFTRFFVALFAASSLVAAAPTPSKRGLSVPDVLNSLQPKVQTVLATIDSLAGDGGLTEKTLGPVVAELTNMIDAASVQLGGLVDEATSLAAPVLDTLPLGLKRQLPGVSIGSVAPTLSGIVTDVSSVVSNVQSVASSLPVAGPMVDNITGTLGGMLATVESLVPGVLPNVFSTVGSPVTSVLGGAGLGNILSGLGVGDALAGLPVAGLPVVGGLGL